MSDVSLIAASVSAMELEDQPNTIGGSLFLLLKSKLFCDVIFTFPNAPERIEAHGVCLKARSPVFQQMLGMRKSVNAQADEIEISECTPERFQQFLEFIYTDKFEGDITAAVELFRLSLKYKVRPLTLKCEALLQTEIPIMHSIKVFEAAREYGRREIMNRAGPIMVKSFIELVRAGSLGNAEVDTLVCLLECDDLAVKEVGLFQFILDWGKKQAGTSTIGELLKNKLKNLMPKIRYTLMAPDEFTQVVVPTGLLSAVEIISVYSYFCGNEDTRRHLQIKFNITDRKVGPKATLTKNLDLSVGRPSRMECFPAFAKHCLSFKADQTQADGKVGPEYFLKKTVITAITFHWPFVVSQYKEQDVLNVSVSIGEFSGPVKQDNFIIRFQIKLLNCKQGYEVRVPVDPPVEFVSGRMYSVAVEDIPTSGLNDSFRNDLEAYSGFLAPHANTEPKVHLDGVCVTLKGIQRKTDCYSRTPPDWSEDLSLIAQIKVGLM